MNLAVTLTTMGRPDEASLADDQAIGLERRWYRGWARAQKADWLHRLGRTDEAIREFESLAREGWTNGHERAAYAHNIDVLRAQAR